LTIRISSEKMAEQGRKHERLAVLELEGFV
jgi:hypothetical protein